MLAALLLTAAQPRIAIRITTPAWPIGLAHGQHFPRRTPPVRGRTWAAFVVITVPF